ncbi:MAG: hypothetical protein FWE76_06205 [Symbiobacteriaceae bacterium]|nr:hypothetical protein [Symbiobacteriaceae bacterium]
MSRFGSDIQSRFKEKQRVSEVRRQRIKETQETQVLREQAEQALDEGYLKIRDSIKPVEDLRLLLKQKQLLIYADLTALKEREQTLLKKLNGLTSLDLFSESLRNEINEFNRLYSEFEHGFDEKSPEAQHELVKKQRQLKENMRIVLTEISSTMRLIDDMLRNPTIQTFFAASLNQSNLQLGKFAAVMRRLNPDVDNLQTSLYLTENIKRLVRRARSRCDVYREMARNLDSDLDTPETFLYAEPYYFRFPQERVPQRIVERLKIVSVPSRQ